MSGYLEVSHLSGLAPTWTQLAIKCLKFVFLLPSRKRQHSGRNETKSDNMFISRSFTALFNNMRTLKFKSQPTNGFFAAVNQMFGGSS